MKSDRYRLALQKKRIGLAPARSQASPHLALGIWSRDIPGQMSQIQSSQSSALDPKPQPYAYPPLLSDWGFPAQVQSESLGKYPITVIDLERVFFEDLFRNPKTDINSFDNDHKGVLFARKGRLLDKVTGTAAQQ